MLTWSDMLGRNESRASSDLWSDRDDFRLRYVDAVEPLRIGRPVLQLWVQGQGAFLFL